MKSENCCPPGDLQRVPCAEARAGIRADLEGRFTWPPAFMSMTRPLLDLGAAMDLTKLDAVAMAVHNERELAFAIVSKEYIRTGLNWIQAMRRIGVGNFLIIAGDRFTSDKLDALDVPNVLAEIDESGVDGSFVSTTGFSAKGLAVSAFKFPVAHFLLRSGYNVVLSDADAIWLQDPMPFLRDADIAFQRIVYHPPSIAMLWGFAACGGFLSFRNGHRTIPFVERCIEAHRVLYCDQLAMNLALLDEEPDWWCEQADWMLPAPGVHHDRSSLEVAFSRYAKYPIRGELRKERLEVLALCHDKFWRHACVTSSLPDTVVCHPNSPKDDLEKMKILEAAGLRFGPEGRRPPR
jgi:hypothetical protein